MQLVPLSHYAAGGGRGFEIKVSNIGLDMEFTKVAPGVIDRKQHTPKQFPMALQTKRGKRAA